MRAPPTLDLMAMMTIRVRAGMTLALAVAMMMLALRSRKGLTRAPRIRNRKGLTRALRLRLKSLTKALLAPTEAHLMTWRRPGQRK